MQVGSIVYGPDGKAGIVLHVDDNSDYGVGWFASTEKVVKDATGSLPLGEGVSPALAAEVAPVAPVAEVPAAAAAPVGLTAEAIAAAVVAALRSVSAPATVLETK